MSASSYLDGLFVVALAAFLALTVAALALVARRTRTGLDRILALDLAGLLLVGGLAALAAVTGDVAYLDAAAILALLSFTETIAASRYVAERKVF